MKKFSIFNFYHKGTSLLRQASQFSIRFQQGFSVLEVLLASTMFVIFSTAAVVAVIGGFTANRLGQENSIATQFASEGLEAVRSIRNQGFSNIDGLASTYCSSGTGVQITGGVWVLKSAGTSDTLASDSRFSRVITICDADRTATASSNLGTTGTVYKNVKKVTSTVTWTFSTGHSSTVALTTYLSNWRSKKGGMLVFGDGGTTANTVKYQVYNANTDTWTAAAATATVGSTGYALRAVRVYASKTRNEKIAISRHYNGSSTQEIWAQVYDGNAGTWGHPTRLSSFAATTFLDVRNFDGAYLRNGDFMAVYSDGTATPKFATWNGSGWTTGISMTALGTSTHIPVYVVARQRPGTNEVMAGFTDQANATDAQYFNGGTYVAGNWSAVTALATKLTTNTKELIDFDWTTDTQGAIIFSAGSSGTAARSISTAIFTANGSGGGSWGGTTTSPQVSGTSQVGPINLDSRTYANTYLVCNKHSGNAIVCFSSDLTATWSTPTNNTIAAATETGIERSYDVGYEATSGAQAVIVYSDNTTTPKYKKYDPVTTTFDANPTNLSAMAGTVAGVRGVPQPAGDDIMFLIFDSTLKLSTVVWNTSANAMYSSGGKAQTAHPGANTGSASTEFWANFAWDNY